jgi:hypothetical protein
MKTLILVAVASLALAPTAAAKEILGVQLCGADGCTNENGAGLHEGPGGPMSDGTSIPPAAPGSWYRGQVLAGDHGKVYGHIPFYYLPGGTVVLPGHDAQTTTWMKASGAWRKKLDAAAARVKPYGPPTITRVSLNGRSADDPQSYLKLYTIGGEATTYPREPASVQIVLESQRRTPWTDGNYIVLYAKSRLLVRDGRFVSLPRDVVDRIGAGASLDTGGSFPWLLLGGGLAGILVVAGSVLLLRRRPGPLGRPAPEV